MKEVVWVFGVSGSGKETFIKHISENKPILKRLGWLNKTIASCPESLKNVGQFENDPVIDKRENIIERVPALLKTVEVVLIKWQFVDSKAFRPQRLKEVTPQAKQRIILLTTPKSELVERLTKKTWWHEYGKEEKWIELELDMVAGNVRQLSDDFEVTTVESGTAAS